MGTGKIMNTITFNGIIFGYLKCCVSYKKKGGTYILMCVLQMSS